MISPAAIKAAIALVALVAAGAIGYELADARWLERETARLEAERQAAITSFDQAVTERLKGEAKNEEIHRDFQVRLGSESQRHADARATVRRLRAALSEAAGKSPEGCAAAGQPDGPAGDAGDGNRPAEGAEQALSDHLAACKLTTEQLVGLQRYVREVVLAP